jgi:xanthine/CO dehydrogenase XdhC/CoxF family maturation factor
MVDSRQLFTEVLVPPPKLLVCGAGDDARPLVELATRVGFRVYVADHRTANLTAERFPAARKLLKLRPQHPSPELPADETTYAVVQTHALEHDKGWVNRLLATKVPYVGVLGPRARIRKILADLDAVNSERVYGPVGLDIGADGPEQVALSVVAEVLAVFSQRQSGHLREREAALHVES